MEVREMTNDQLKERLEELRAIGENPEERSADELEALAEERQAIDAEYENRRQQAAAEQLRREDVANGQIGGNIMSTMPEIQEKRTYDASSPEYRSAWLKNIAVRNDVHLFGEMNAEEREAWTHTTANTGAVVPTAVMNRIVELVESNYPMYNDAAKDSMISGFGIPRHKTIAQGDAAVTNEGAANDDEKDTFDLLPLAGVEIKKHIVISRKMKWQSIQAFEDWVVRHLADRIGVAKETRILAQLDDATYGIAAGNVVASAQATDAGIRALLAKIKGQGTKVVYANANTIWTKLAAIDTTAGDKAFITNPQVDPVTQGRIYGCEVKLDDNLTDNVVYIGIPRMLLANDFEELFINHAMDPKTFEDIVAGYSLFDAGLENPQSFVKATFS